MELSLSLSLFHISFSFRHVSTLAQRYVRFVLALFLSLTLLLSFATRIKNSLRRHNIWPRRCSLGSPFFLFFSSLSFFFPRNLATRRVNSKVNYLTSAERQTLRNEEYREYFEEGESTRGVSSLSCAPTSR